MTTMAYTTLHVLVQGHPQPLSLIPPLNGCHRPLGRHICVALANFQKKDDGRATNSRDKWYWFTKNCNKWKTITPQNFCFNL